MKKGQHIALVGNYGFDFNLFRIPLAIHISKNGHSPFALVPEDSFLDQVRDSGVPVLPFHLKRNSINPFSLFRSVRELKTHGKHHGFSIVHSFSLQPNILSILAFGRVSETRIVNHITGLGHSFTSRSIRAILIRFFILLLYQILFLFSDRIIVQNKDDHRILSSLFFIRKKLVLIPGSGVDIAEFTATKANAKLGSTLKKNLFLPDHSLVITFIGRLIAEKGIREFIQVAKMLSNHEKDLVFLIIGYRDERNPSCLRESEIDELASYQKVRFLGRRNDIREILSLTDIFVLPTYREGFPRSVLEAMSMGIPVITTDVPGSRDAVRNSFNGFLVQPGSTKELMEATIQLINDKSLRKRMGENGRKLMEEKFSSQIIFREFMNVYDELLV